MKWFRHDSNANLDAKLKKLRLKYGMEGYGVYWYCLELIAGCVDRHNLTFELEHDSEIIAADTGIHRERIEEMMGYMVELGLFENSEGTITCLKMASRTDEYIGKLLRTESGDHPDKLPPLSGQSQEKVPLNRREETRTKRKNSTHPLPPDFGISERVRKWANEKGYDRLDEHLEAFKLKATAKGYQYADWDSAFMEAIRKNWAGLQTEQPKGKRVK